MIGKIHSIQSLGAVDGPGLRYVVFLQGCPLRCIYCHNPDTWDYNGGREMTVKELSEQILRYKPYFGDTGGVTLSGGEPLMQGGFAAALFQQLKKLGIHTAIDTSGHGTKDAIEAVLPYTDLVLCDLKFATEEQYKAHTGGSLSQVLCFLEQTATYGTEVWIRHVVVPGMTDTPHQLRAICTLASRYPNIKKIELLPFRKFCIEKYDAMQLPFPLETTPACPAETIEQLQHFIPTVYR